MSDMSEYERRISAALARIGAGIETLGQAPTATTETSGNATFELREALEAERTANAQLSERVRAIREKQESTLGALERKLAAANRDLEQHQRDAVRLKRANADLLGANRALSEAAAEALADPHLINRAMQAELEALRAERAADLSEIDDILAGLEPLLAGPNQTGVQDA